MCLARWKKRKQQQEESYDEQERIPLEKHDKLAMLISAYAILIPGALLAIGTILFVAMLLFRLL